MDRERLEAIARRHGLELILAFGSAVTGPVHARSDLSFRTARVLALLLLAVVGGCAGPGSGPQATGILPTALGIPITVSKPDGPGPFPAVVIMHDCSGLGPRSSGAPGRWATELVRRGYAVLMPDSFGSRGYPDGVCTVPLSERRIDVGPERRAEDAYAALAHARALPYVDGPHIGIMGGSHGGSTTLATLARKPLPGADPAGFAAGVALYPRCAIRSGAYEPVAPLLILIGDRDDWTPAEPCRRLVEAARRAGQPVAIKVYPGAHHAFDSPNPVRYVAARINPNAPGGRGATTGGDPAAWADSIREVAAFLGGHLGATAGSR
jgi:dienelactone hydrolase